MTAANIANAASDARTGIAMVPSSVPPGWAGPAASACQIDLDCAQQLLSGIEALLITATDAAVALDNATSYQCVAPS